MANFNKVLLMGNLTRDPELRYTPGGQAKCAFALAINREWTGKDGDRKKDVTFIDITVWGKQGETCAQYLKKGRPCFVEGRLATRSWETEDGQKRKAFEVVADRVQFLGSGTGGGGGGGGGGRGEAPGASRGEPEDVGGGGDEPPVEDDIPF